MVDRGRLERLGFDGRERAPETPEQESGQDTLHLTGAQDSANRDWLPLLRLPLQLLSSAS